MTKRTVTLACLAGALLAAPAAQATTCIKADDRDHLRRADAAFVARVISVRESDGSALFRVRSVLKGGLTRGAVTRVFPEGYPRTSISIGWKPQPGQRWRLYVDRRDGRWLTHDCMGTRRA